ncbi:hypothetical protein H2200_006974 [Cladophialophora chaetospira]|uniref:F-box domain-containing protein n=1 Tax=Cladophialophora chaetospira TaxID=386627 RepID=A0AA38X9C2_9EURO|nr:hypothetical protein H2200_006974 [Cladophialophora chaetospira]
MPSKRKQQVVDESWLEDAKRSNTRTAQIVRQSRPAHRALFIEDIVHIIIDFVALLPDDERQRTLWACASVSRTWYEVALRRLYHSPELATRNIDLFARTVCSGRKNSQTSAHIAQLKSAVRHLKITEADQKARNSTIGRVLDRVNSSLESYESSTVTANTSILSSLSRCTNLKFLDLTANLRELNFLDILDATAMLPRLETLKTPQNCLSCQCDRLQGSLLDLRWPPALRSLQLPGFFFWDNQDWVVPNAVGWPKTLRSLSIMECLGYYPFANGSPWRPESEQCTKAPQIESLEIGNSRGYGSPSMELDGLFGFFPNLKTLKIPAEAALHKDAVQSLRHINATQLEVLDLQPPPDYAYPFLRWDLTPTGCPASLDQYVTTFPNLRRMTVPDAVIYVEQSLRRKDPAYYNETVQPSLEALNTALQDRSASKDRGNSGLFINAADRPAMIDEEIRRCGMVYSINAPSRYQMLGSPTSSVS